MKSGAPFLGLAKYIYYLTCHHSFSQTLFVLGFCVNFTAINCTSDKTVASLFHVTQLLGHCE